MTLDHATTVASRVGAVRGRIAAACRRSGRDASSVTLIGVSKTQPASALVAAYRAGITDFGENRVQEATTKIPEVMASLGAASPPPVFHLIGHLQTNKVRSALASFALIHSVDSDHLLTALDAAATAPVRILLEVNVAGEASKFGVTPATLTALAGLAQGLPNIDLLGLMTVAPLVPDPGQARPVFQQLRAMAQDLGLSTLSMGMTDDFEVAIEEGATHVRVGRAIFGERNT